MAALVNSGTAGLNQYPVDFRLMKNLLMSAKAVAPYLEGTMPGVLERNSGTDSVKWERIENLDPQTTPLGELTDDALPTRSSIIPVITPVTASMLKYGAPIRLTEELELMSVNARANKFTRKLGENAGRTLSLVAESIWRADIDTATAVLNKRYAGGTFSGVPATDRATVDAILGGIDTQWANNFLNRNDGIQFRPEGHGSTNIDTRTIRDSYIGIVHSDVEEDIRTNSDFRSSETYGGYTGLYVGEFGASHGVRWISTSLAPIIPDAGTANAAANGLRTTSGTNVDVYVSYIYAEEALGSVGLGEQHTKEIYMTGDRLPAVELIQHGRGSAGTADPLNEIITVGWKSWFTGKVLNQNWVTKLESGASVLS